MRVIGIDPGYAIVGYGIVEYQNMNFKTIEYGAILTDKDMPFNRRILKIYDDLMQILCAYKPEAMAVEKLFFNNNQKTAIDVAQARGIILLASEKIRFHFLNIHLYK